jgi:hypothetical protein
MYTHPHTLTHMQTTNVWSTSPCPTPTTCTFYKATATRLYVPENRPWESNKQTHTMQPHSRLRTAKQLITNCKLLTQQGTLLHNKAPISVIYQDTKNSRPASARVFAWRNSRAFQYRMHSWTRAMQQRHQCCQSTDPKAKTTSRSSGAQRYCRRRILPSQPRHSMYPVSLGTHCKLARK